MIRTQDAIMPRFLRVISILWSCAASLEILLSINVTGSTVYGLSPNPILLVRQLAWFDRRSFIRLCSSAI
jgi:hypothetical protein